MNISSLKKLYLNMETSNLMKFILILFTTIQIAVTGILTITVFDLKNKIEEQQLITKYDTEKYDENKKDNKEEEIPQAPIETSQDKQNELKTPAFFRFINEDTIFLWFTDKE